MALIILVWASAIAWGATATQGAETETRKTNILIIWGDDIGYWNISAYSQGMMGYKTPNIDRIAREGTLFTDWYGQQSCTAGRAAFITGQVGFRTGLLKVGLPGAQEGLQARDVTIAELLKTKAYKTGQFGKNHLGDRDGHLPTAHGFDVPCAIRWPGVIKPGMVLNDVFAHEDMLPTLLAAAGNADVKGQLLQGMKVSDRTFKLHLDGYNMTDALAGKSPSPRHEFFYFNDDGSLVGLRYDQWKIVFAEQRAHGLDVWEEPFVALRLPKLFNLRSDRFETADHADMDYERWRVEHLFVMVPAQQYVGKFLATFKEFPPSQKPGSFSIDRALEALQKGAQGGGG